MNLVKGFAFIDRLILISPSHIHSMLEWKANQTVMYTTSTVQTTIVAYNNI